MGLFEPDAAFLRVELGVAAMVNQAIREGAEIRSNATVLSWTVNDNGVVRVETDRGDFLRQVGITKVLKRLGESAEFPGEPGFATGGGENDPIKWGKDQSYKNLVAFARHPGPESDLDMFNPMEWHVSTSPLIQMLRKVHHGVQLD